MRVKVSKVTHTIIYRLRAYLCRIVALWYVVAHSRLQGVPPQDGSAEVRGSPSSSGRTSAGGSTEVRGSHPSSGRTSAGSSTEVRGSHPSSGRTSARIAALREGCSRISTPPSFPLTSAGEKCR